MIIVEPTRAGLSTNVGDSSSSAKEGCLCAPAELSQNRFSLVDQVAPPTRIHKSTLTYREHNVPEVLVLKHLQNANDHTLNG